jgi:ribosomal protein S12 methylthiotransferase accessory factor YcaO
VADEAASRSITLPRDRDGLIPVDPRRYPRVLHVVYARGEDLTAGRALGSALGVYFGNLTTRRLTPDSPATAYEDLAWERGAADLVVVSAFVPPRAGAGDVAVPESFSRFVQESGEGKPTVVLSMGNPYPPDLLP